MLPANAPEREFRILVHSEPRSKSAKFSLGYEQEVRQAAHSVVSAPLSGSVSIRVFYFHTARRPIDVDNLLKAVLDGLKGAAYQDDSQVDQVAVERFNISPGPVRIDHEWLVDAVDLAIANQKSFVAIVVSGRARE